MAKNKGSRRSRGLLPPGVRVVSGFKDGKLTRLVKYKDKMPPEHVLKQFDTLVIFGRAHYKEITLDPKSRTSFKNQLQKAADRLASLQDPEWTSPE